MFFKCRKTADEYVERVRAMGYCTAERENQNGVTIDAWRPVQLTDAQRSAIKLLQLSLETCANLGVGLSAGLDGEQYLGVDEFDDYELEGFNAESIGKFLERN